MMNKTDIEWTTFTANPLKYRRKSDGKVVWACVKTSPGCKACYAEQIALRFERGKLFNARNMEELEPFLDEKELREMRTRKTCGGVAVDGSRCFVADMTDVFGEWVPDSFLDRLFAVMALRMDVTFQVLTKRAERMRDYFAGFRDTMLGRRIVARDMPNGGTLIWPLPNVWLGVSVEDQQRADERIPLLLQTPASVRFLSVEPMLGPIDLRLGAERWRCSVCGFVGTMADEVGMGRCLCGHELEERIDSGIHWVIAGGESGHGARPCNVAWVRSIVEQCLAADVPCFVKQLGSRPVWNHIVPGCSAREHLEPLTLRDSKGGSPAEWPQDLRVRDFPVS